MFKSLKDKLKGVSKKFGSNIDEAIEKESETTGAESRITEETLETPSEASDIDSSPEKTGEKKTEKKPGFTQKVKVLVTEREVLLTEKDISEPLEELELILLENDVAFDTTEAIIGHMKDDLVGKKRKIGKNSEKFVIDALKDAILEVLGDSFLLTDYIDTHEKPVKVLFTGVNGAGKTTTIAKVAFFLKSQGYSVVIGSGDTFRAGANQQMKTHADRIGVKVISHQEGADPSAVLFDAVNYAKAHDIDVVLADTAGRFHNKGNLMKQLEKIRRVMNPDIVAYVDEAVAGNDAVIRAEEFNTSVGTDVVVLTKADMDTKGGAAISIAHTIGKPLMFLGMGQGYDDIVAFEPEKMVEDLLEGD